MQFALWQLKAQLWVNSMGYENHENESRARQNVLLPASEIFQAVTSGQKCVRFSPLFSPRRFFHTAMIATAAIGASASGAIFPSLSAA